MKALPVLLVILVALVAAGGYLFYMNWNSVPERLIPLIPYNNDNIEKSLIENSPAKSKQFYDNMRFPDTSISYDIDSRCSSNKRDDAIEALSIIEQNTVLQFKQTSSDADLEVSCSNDAPEPSSKDHYVAGEGGPTEILNSSLYSVIIKAQISLFREENCGTPHIALHELLHALGFDHNSNPKSILYPTLDCSQQVDQYIYDEINRLYSVESLPDLAIVSVSAVKSRKYLATVLDFNIEIANRGLDSANGVTLSLYADTKFIEEFDLKIIDIGTRKILNVTDMQIPGSTKKVTFVVDENNKINELYEDNNEMELVLPEQ